MGRVHVRGQARADTHVRVGHKASVIPVIAVVFEVCLQQPYPAVSSSIRVLKLAS